MKIACLPLAGDKNPYQVLMMQGLAEGGHHPIHGESGKWFALTRTWRNKRPNVIHLDWPGGYYLRSNFLLSLVQAFAFWMDVKIFSLMNGRLVWTAHNIREHEVPHPKLDLIIKRLLAAVATRIRVFAAEQVEDGSYAFKQPFGKFFVQPEGSYIGWYPSGATREQALIALQLPATDGITLLNFGNLRPYKGTDDLILAFKRVAPPTARLLIAGPPHHTTFVELCRELAAGDERIIIKPGFVEVAHVQHYFAAADVAIFPFKRIDNSGTVILAMGFGLPIVAPTAGAVAERLMSQKNLLYGQNQLIEGLKKVFETDAVRLKKIGTRNNEEVQKHKWVDFAKWF